MKFFPSNIFARFTLIILLPIVVLEMITAYIFFERHWENVSRRLEESLIGSLNVILDVAKHNQLNLPTIAKHLDFQVSFKNSCPIKPIPDELQLLYQKIKYNASTLQAANWSGKDQSNISLYFALEGRCLVATFTKKKFVSPTTLIFISWSIGAAGMLVLISFLFMKNQVRSIMRLADAAEKFGKGQDIGHFKPTGAKEIRALGKSFLRMKERIENQILHRTDMLAHISHDLRTPLTRLKLQVAIIKKQELVRDMDKNLDEMDNLIRGYLNFAKEEGNEFSTRFDLLTLVKESVRLINDPRLEIKSNTKSIIVDLKKDAIKRVLKNLVTNAQKYCTSKIILGVYKKSSENFIITIDDDGPGINPKNYKKAFKPFNKLNSDKEGFGLGLSIIKSIILSHGGNIKLAKSELGGLRVIIRIPL